MEDAERAAVERISRALAEGYRRALTRTHLSEELREQFSASPERERRLLILAWVIALAARHHLAGIVADRGEEWTLASFAIQTLRAFERVDV